MEKGFKNMDLKVNKEVRVPVEVYSRVVGYFRPVKQWNAGKKEEFRERLTFRF